MNYTLIYENTICIVQGSNQRNLIQGVTATWSSEDSAISVRFTCKCSDSLPKLGLLKSDDSHTYTINNVNVASSLLKIREFYRLVSVEGNHTLCSAEIQICNWWIILHLPLLCNSKPVLINTVPALRTAKFRCICENGRNCEDFYISIHYYLNSCCKLLNSAMNWIAQRNPSVLSGLNSVVRVRKYVQQILSYPFIQHSLLPTV